MIKSGMVVKVERRTAIVMSPTGEFHKIGIKGEKPFVGQELQGEIIKRNTYYRSIIAAAIILFVVLSGVMYNRYTPYAVVRVNINPSIELKADRQGEVVSFKGLNKDGERVLSEISIKNKALDDALKLIVTQAKKDNFINSQYTAKGNIITVNISSKDNSKLNLQKFEQYIATNGLNAEINDGNSQKKIESSETKVSPQNIVSPENQPKDDRKQELPLETKEVPNGNSNSNQNKATEKASQNNSAQHQNSNSSNKQKNDNNKNQPQIDNDNGNDNKNDKSNNGKSKEQNDSKDKDKGNKGKKQ